MTDQDIEQLKAKLKEDAIHMEGRDHPGTAQLYRESLRAIEHLQAQVPKWVLVEEWDKKEHEAVLVRTSDSEGTDLLQWDGYRWTDGSGYGFPVTHVMALPEGPKS